MEKEHSNFFGLTEKAAWKKELLETMASIAAEMDGAEIDLTSDIKQGFVIIKIFPNGEATSRKVGQLKDDTDGFGAANLIIQAFENSKRIPEDSSIGSFYFEGQSVYILLTDTRYAVLGYSREIINRSIACLYGLIDAIDLKKPEVPKERVIELVEARLMKDVAQVADNTYLLDMFRSLANKTLSNSLS